MLILISKVRNWITMRITMIMIVDLEAGASGAYVILFYDPESGS